MIRDTPVDFLPLAAPGHTEQTMSLFPRHCTIWIMNAGESLALIVAILQTAFIADLSS